jgi:hypothetical protein
LFNYKLNTTTGPLEALRVPNHAAHFFNGLDAGVDVAGKAGLSYWQKSAYDVRITSSFWQKSALEKNRHVDGLADA